MIIKGNTNYYGDGVVAVEVLVVMCVDVIVHTTSASVRSVAIQGLEEAVKLFKHICVIMSASRRANRRSVVAAMDYHDAMSCVAELADWHLGNIMNMIPRSVHKSLLTQGI